MKEGETVAKQGKVQLWQEDRAFFQASTVRGARYLDDAGKIMNEYGDDYYDTSVGLGGLRLAKPKRNELPDEIAVDMNRIWVACYGEGCIKKVKENAEGITKAVSRYIGVDAYSRLGFRVYYFKKVANVKGYVQRLYSTVAATQVQTLVGSPDAALEIIFRTRYLSPPFSIWFGVQPLAVVRPPEKKEDFASDGVIIDIDVSEDKDSSKRSLSPKHLSTFLKDSSDYAVQKANETIAFLKGLEGNGNRR
jgi:hypothetical protein